MVAFLVAGLIAALVTGPFAAPASAGTNCDPGHHCVFYQHFDSAKRQFFDSNPDFTRYTFNAGGNLGRGQPVNDNNWALSNSSTGNYYSEYFLHKNYAGHNGVGDVLICVAPGGSVAAERMTLIGGRGDGQGQRDEASSLFMNRNPTATICLG